MIARLRGEVVSRGLDRAVVECAGVGYEFFAAADFLATLEEGSSTVVHTYQVVREDALTLYGFGSAQERQVFALLLGASGVGPKLALAALGTFDPASLAAAVASEDLAALTRIPGLGKKSAQKFVVALGDKLAPYAQQGATSPASGGAGVASGGVSAQIIIALEQMGWKVAEAKAAVDHAAQQNAEAGAEELLREALRYLGAGRA